MKAPDEKDAMVVVWLALGLCFCLCLCAVFPGCGGAAPSMTQQGQVAAYGGAEAICIEGAATKAQADGCRDRVKVAFCGDGGIFADSGACDEVRLSDGGKP